MRLEWLEDILAIAQTGSFSGAAERRRLTHAALEMAAVGVAVAWVPQSLALERILNGSLVDLSDVMPSCELQVKAVRIHGKPSTAEAALWAQLIELGV